MLPSFLLVETALCGDYMYVKNEFLENFLFHLFKWKKCQEEKFPKINQFCCTIIN